ncbi:MAG: hypothetical protein WA708_14560 [Acidobacteriaceae bacterium]
MRRWSAFVLLLLTAFLPLRPLLASAQQEASLPACCRRNGAHHCMMLQYAAVADASGHASILPSPCPLWKLAAAPAVVAAAATPLQMLSQPALLGNVPVAQSVVLSVSIVRHQSTRAPPVISI